MLPELSYILSSRIYYTHAWAPQTAHQPTDWLFTILAQTEHPGYVTNFLRCQQAGSK